MAIVGKAGTGSFSGSILGLTVRPLSYLIRPDGSLAKRFFGKVTTTGVASIVGASR